MGLILNGRQPVLRGQCSHLVHHAWLHLIRSFLRQLSLYRRVQSEHTRYPKRKGLKMGAWGYVRAVLWSFFGVRRRAAAGDELTKAKPLVLVAVAIALAALFGLMLYALANLAVHSLVT